MLKNEYTTLVYTGNKHKMQLSKVDCKHEFKDNICERCNAWHDEPCEPHLFVTTVAREPPSCLGSHRAECKRCGMNYFYYTTEYICITTEHEIKTGEKIDHHVCVWDSDDMTICCSSTGECPSDKKDE